MAVREKLMVWGIPPNNATSGRPIRIDELSRTAADKEIARRQRLGWTGLLSGPKGMSYQQIIDQKRTNATVAQVAALRGVDLGAVNPNAPRAASTTAARTAGS